MAKEILLYTGIYSFVAEEIINAIEANMNDEVILRINSGGGDVHATWGIIAKITEHGNVTIKVDGAAMSSAANILMYAAKVESLDVSNFVLHRAEGYVTDDDDQAFLNKVNKDLKAKMISKIDPDKFKAITGYTVEQLFNPETRINVFLTAKQMKDIGVVNKITKVNPTEMKAFNEQMRIAAEHNPATTKIEIQNPINMTLAEFKAQHPSIFAEALALGVAQEKDRVGAFMVYNEIDPVGVKKAIAEGTSMTQTMMAEFGMKVFAKAQLKVIADDNAPPVKTDEVLAKEKTAKEKEIAEFEASAKADWKKFNGVGSPMAVSPKVVVDEPVLAK